LAACFQAFAESPEDAFAEYLIFEVRK